MPDTVWIISTSCLWDEVPPRDRPVACRTSAILSEGTSLAASLCTVNFNQPLIQSTSLTFQSTYTPSFQTRPFTLCTISCGPWCSPQLCPMECWLWQSAITTSVYLISFLLSEPLARPSLTSRLLSQDSIFDFFREVCTSRKTPLDPAKRHHKNRKRGSTYTHTHR